VNRYIVEALDPRCCVGFGGWHYVRVNRDLLSVIGSLIFATALVCRADTIQLSSGQEVKATVTKYRNHAFEVRSDDGKNASYPSNNVKRVQFDPRESPSKLVTRTNGLQEGNVIAFENGGFVVTQPSGTRTFSAIFVEQAEFVADRGQSVEVISHGQQIDVSKHLALGNVTIVDFYADWCGPCKVVDPTIKQLAQSDPEIAVRKIDIVNWSSAVAKQYHVSVLPRVEVYGRKGQLVGTVSGADPAQVRQYVTQAKSGAR
jgi:thiol-disulfide isomerase/thioredoxin